MLVQDKHVLQAIKAARNTGLVCHQRQTKARALEPLQGFHGTIGELPIRYAVNVSVIDVQCAVSIEECDFRWHPVQPPFMAVNILRYISIAAGPTSTTKIPGKMNSTSGKISLTAVLAAFSSANCRRRVRIESLCTRRACATLEPNLSA